MKEKLMRFMEGRYGSDQFSQFLLVVGLISLVVSMLLNGNAVGNVFYLLGLLVLIYCYFRMFSRNVSKRYAENESYLAKTSGIRRFFQKQKNLMQQRKVYHIYKCPGCKQKIRIPKGKGKIEIRCPKCGATFVKKS